LHQKGESLFNSLPSTRIAGGFLFRFAQLSKDTKKWKRHGCGLERAHLIPVTITEHGLTADLTREGSLR
jgi:hypothetical protein